MKPIQFSHLVLCCFALAAYGCGEPPAEIHATNGKLSAACNWNGECPPESRFFNFDGTEVDLRLIFAPGVDAADSLASIRANLEAADVDIIPALIPTGQYTTCGQTRPSTKLISYQGGILSGRIHGNVTLCRVVQGDILDSTGIDPAPFTIVFELAFDPREKPMQPPQP